VHLAYKKVEKCQSLLLGRDWHFSTFWGLMINLENDCYNGSVCKFTGANDIC